MVTELYVQQDYTPHPQKKQPTKNKKTGTLNGVHLYHFISLG